MNICQWESSVQSDSHICSQLIKNNNSWTICNSFNATKSSLCIIMWQWMKHKSTTSLQSQISCHLSGQQQVKSVQSDQRRKHQPAGFWPSCFGIRKVFCSSITMRKEGPSIALLEPMKEEITKKNSHKEKKGALSPRQCTVSRVDHNDSKSTWIALLIASGPTLLYRSGFQWLLAVCRPQKNAPGKEIWLQWRSDIRNWGVFCRQRQILLQKRHRIVKEALESAYNPRRR